MKTTTFCYFFAALILFCFLITSEFLYSQTKFQRAIGGTNYDNSYSIIQTSDGGYAIGGYTTSFGAGLGDMYIVKLDASGVLQWSKAIGGTGDDAAYSLIQTPDSGYALAGHTYSFGAGSSDMYIVKLDPSGSLMWSKTIGGPNIDFAYSIIETSDDGYALAGCTYSFGAGEADMFMAKLDASGSLQWSKTIGGTSSDYAYSIIQATDGGYALAGSTQSFGTGSTDIYITKLDVTGLIQWSKTIGGKGLDIAYSIIQTTDGGYATGGSYTFINIASSMNITKLNSTGSLLWSQSICGINEEEGSSVIQTSDGGYVLSGKTYSVPGSYNKFIAKTDAYGNIQWNNAFMVIGNLLGNSVIRTTDGGYAVAAQTNNFGAGNWDMYMVKVDANGVTCGNSNSFPCSNIAPILSVTTPISIVNSPSPVITTPTTTVSSGAIVSNVCNVLAIEKQNEIPNEFKLLQNYPNPFNPTTKISFDLPKPSIVKLGVYDLSGKVVAVLVNENLNAGTYSFDFDGSNLSSGVYFYRIFAGSFNEVKKMVLVK